MVPRGCRGSGFGCSGPLGSRAPRWRGGGRGRWCRRPVARRREPSPAMVLTMPSGRGGIWRWPSGRRSPRARRPGRNKAEFAWRVGRHRSTIGRELNREDPSRTPCRATRRRGPREDQKPVLTCGALNKISWVEHGSATRQRPDPRRRRRPCRPRRAGPAAAARRTGPTDEPGHSWSRTVALDVWHHTDLHMNTMTLIISYNDQAESLARRRDSRPRGRAGSAPRLDGGSRARNRNDVRICLCRRQLMSSERYG